MVYAVCGGRISRNASYRAIDDIENQLISWGFYASVYIIPFATREDTWGFDEAWLTRRVDDIDASVTASFPADMFSRLTPQERIVADDWWLEWKSRYGYGSTAASRRRAIAGAVQDILCPMQYQADFLITHSSESYVGLVASRARKQHIPVIAINGNASSKTVLRTIESVVNRKRR